VSLLVHDSERVVSDQAAIVDLLGASTAANSAQLTTNQLLPGTTYTWRVRVWTSAGVSSWAKGRLTTALFDGFAAEPIWLGGSSEQAGAAAGAACDLSGLWKGNGCGGGCAISITKAGAGTYHVKTAWTGSLAQNGTTVVLSHGGGRIAHTMPFNSSSAPCTQIKFENGDDWCKADACGAPHPSPHPPPGPPAPPAKDKGSSYAYFRHSEALRGDVASASVFVSANQDGSLKKLLSAYRLYVNGKVVSIGPGRGDSANSAANHTVYDSVDITAELKQAWAENGYSASVVFAAQCYHHDSGADAMFMLQAHVAYTSAEEELHTIVSDASWVGYNANKIYNPTGGMGGDVGKASSDNQPAEYIDAAAVLPGWQSASYKPGAGWGPVVARTWVSPPAAKETLPISFNPGLKPVEMTLLAPGHWFVDFGTEIMAGLTVTVHGGKAGTQMNVKLSEELLCKGCAPTRTGGGGAGKGKGCNTCDFNETTKAILYPMR